MSDYIYLKDDVKELESYVQDVDYKLDCLVTKVTDYSQRVDDLQLEINRLTQENNELEARVKALELDADRYKDDGK